MKCIVLLSGGLDSTVSLAWALNEGWDCSALIFEYGQRHSNEIKQAVEVAEHYVIESRVHYVRHPGGSALTGDAHIPMDREIDDSVPATYVPARNLIFLSIATAVAEVAKADRILIGANALDYSGYPDCRPEFLQAFSLAANLGTNFGKPFRVAAPLMAMTKTEIVQLGVELDAPLDLTLSCYHGTRCGRCDACVLRAKGFAGAGLEDPA